MKRNLQLPHLVIVTILAIVVAVLCSWIGAVYDCPVQSLLSAEGIRWMLRHVDEHLVATPFINLFILFIGIGLAESSGLMTAIVSFMRRLSRHKALSIKQKRALFLALLTMVIYVVLVVLATVSPFAFLLGITGTFYRSPFVEGIFLLVSLLFALPGTVYGIASGAFQSSGELIRGMSYRLVRLSEYFIYLFLLSQLIGSLQYSALESYLSAHATVLTVAYNICYYLPILFLWKRG